MLRLAMHGTNIKLFMLRLAMHGTNIKLFMLRLAMHGTNIKLKLWNTVFILQIPYTAEYSYLISCALLTEGETVNR
jgi:hypothetical protein